MSKINDKYQVFRFVLDAIIVVVAYFFIHIFNNHHHIITYESIFFIVIGWLSWYTAAYFSTIYGDRRSKKFAEEIVFIIYTTVIFLILFSAISFLAKDLFILDIGFFFNYVLILFIFMFLSKYAIRKYIHFIIRKKSLYDNVIIVGSTNAALDFYEAINKYYYYGYTCIGYVDNKPNQINGCKYLGVIEELPLILKNNIIDEVVIALPYAQSKQIQFCMEQCDRLQIKARILPDFDLFASTATQVNNIGIVPVINMNDLPLDKIENKLLKRGFDIIFSLFFFATIGWWLLPIIALVIKIGTKGPILFKQERWGLNNEKIICYKFRTMIDGELDINSDGSFNQATKNDPRITTIGHILRSTNFDELPQFWNVLMGNMSIVGPRPHATPMNIESMHSIDNYMFRHIVLPGITGYAQVHGLRGETKTPGKLQKRVNYDLYYIHRWSFWLDCQIILQTIINFIKGDENAY
jgi:putative colanic acid biosynthesis UDP-glucose lipid carrier transferase